MPTAPLVTAENLKVTIETGVYGRSLKHRILGRCGARSTKLILDGVAFSLRSGERVALLGENGSGKTSLLRVIAGILPFSGHLNVMGTVHPLLAPTYGLDPALTVRMNIRMVHTWKGRLQECDAERENRILMLADLPGVGDSHLGELSQGQVARLAFAVARMLRPDILLMDESLAAADTSFVNQVARVLTAEDSPCRSFILVSHDFSILRRMCNRALLLHRSQLYADGSVDALIDAYENLQEQVGGKP
ncbi:ABC transporter ATP-binding protein [Paramagnetospirillum magnetotacticum MS-1]|uniref:ABC transporter ATP-binding protein n=1 Tax=Paramagnetospirillum magnetotacticum MS-1 TaxID=272627 RepID=A0A0C2YWT4_PARME|nr:ATP-binding cassette domain-containing protein [Paramagnetospirillum magnetotacticum]KIL99583.1 ABC transporter ATP-binding protein [Paramagnetospirillum magnetotacticum MS-1]